MQVKLYTSLHFSENRDQKAENRKQTMHRFVPRQLYTPLHFLNQDVQDAEDFQDKCRLNFTLLYTFLNPHPNPLPRRGGRMALLMVYPVPNFTLLYTFWTRMFRMD